MKVSVIVPVYNGEQNIERTLKSIFDNSYNNKEIIVVNDGSEDETLMKLKKFREINLIDKKQNSGIARAVKSGIDIAKGDIIIKVDADSVISRDWISRVVKHFMDNNVVAVGGRYEPINTGFLVDAIFTVDDFFLHFLKRKVSQGKISGPAWAARKKVIKNLDFWDTCKTDEIHLSFRLNKYGKIIYDPDLIVRGEFPSSLSEIWRRKFKWGENSILDEYYKNIRFWIRPLYFFILVLVVFLLFVNLPGISLNILNLEWKLYFVSFLVFPFFILMFYSLVKKPKTFILSPILAYFQEIAWISGCMYRRLRR